MEVNTTNTTQQHLDCEKLAQRVKNLDSILGALSVYIKERLSLCEKVRAVACINAVSATEEMIIAIVLLL